MLFNSYEFIFLFLPITFFIYFRLTSKYSSDHSKGFLVLSSLFFYSWWNVLYLPLILGSITFNFFIKHIMGRNVGLAKRTWLYIGIITNIGLLGLFKYTDFLFTNLNSAFDTNLPILNFALPLAISFFTFQQITYLVDSYKSDIGAHSFTEYALFVSFFPQLIAGPIVHHKEMMPQFLSDRNFAINHRNIAKGLFLFSIGLFKKVAIADTFSVWVNAGFSNPNSLNFLESWMASLSFSFQVYFDFSGYTDMAIGAALLFNIKLPINFNSPYKARSIKEFWRRWHITLSRFFRDYVYIPLGGNRHSELRTCVILIVVFFLGGIWHGAGWNFIAWGTLHGLGMVFQRAWRKLGIALPDLLAWFVTFNFVNASLVIFRGQTLDHGLEILKSMAGLSNHSSNQQFYQLFSFREANLPFYELLSGIQGDITTCLWLLFGFSIILLFPNSNQIIKDFKLTYKTVIWSVVAFTGAIMSLNRVSEFIYFNF